MIISYINIYSFSICGINTNSLLTSSQLAWKLSWLERCTGIAEVMGSVQAWLFSGCSFASCLRLYHWLWWSSSFHISDAVQIYEYFINSLSLRTFVNTFSVSGGWVHGVVVSVLDF